MMEEDMIIWDTEKKFYQLIQKGKTVIIKKDNKIIYDGELLKLKECDIPRPMIINNKLFYFDYEKGFEIHDMISQERKFFDVRAIWNMSVAGSLLFLLKQKKLVIFDLIKEEVTETVATSELFSMEELNGYRLFYLFKRTNSFLYNIQTKEYISLPTFYSKFPIIVKVLKKDNLLVVFYTRAKETEYPEGVYLYDLEKNAGKFYYGFVSDFSANCAKYLPLLNFEFNCDPNENTIKWKEEDYVSYLEDFLKRFGVFAFLYNCDNDKLKGNDTLEAVKEIVLCFREKLFQYPKTNHEFDEIIEELKMAEQKLKEILD